MRGGQPQDRRDRGADRHGAGEVGDGHAARLLPGHPPHLSDPLVVEAVVPGAQEPGEPERAHLLRRLAPAQQPGQVTALPVARGHCRPEPVERAAAPPARQPAGHQRQQRHRDQQRRHGEQRHRSADPAGERAAEPLQAEHQLRRPHDPGLRPRRLVVEVRVVERRQVDRAGDVEDAVLRVALGELGHHPLRLAQHDAREPEHRRDDGQRDRARPHGPQADSRALGLQDRLSHAPPDHHLGSHPDAAEHLQPGHGDQLAPRRLPDNAHTRSGQPRQLPRRLPPARGVHLVDGRPSPLAAGGTCPGNHEHTPIITHRALASTSFPRNGTRRPDSTCRRRCARR
jgi:hypothetical protein